MLRRFLGWTGLGVSILGLGGFHLVEISAAEARTLLNRYLDAASYAMHTS
jgi:aryl-alcohol dehydrogenase-like predicted oxidoreductase